MSTELARVSISIEESLLASFDDYLKRHDYTTRSEAIRDLIRDKLLLEQISRGRTDQVGVLSMVYDHHARELASRLIDKQHEHHDLTVASMHVHLGPRHCLEVSILRGPGDQIRQLADSLLATKGVLHGEIRFTGDEGEFQSIAGHAHPHSHG